MKISSTPLIKPVSPSPELGDKPREHALAENLVKRKTRIEITMTAHNFLVSRGAISD